MAATPQVCSLQERLQESLQESWPLIRWLVRSSLGQLLADQRRVRTVHAAQHEVLAPHEADSVGVQHATSSSWLPGDLTSTCRQQTGAQPRGAGLDVADINAYMARFKPVARATADKGHPDGPRLEPRVRPRHSPALLDNSLRTLDIEGTR